MTLLAALLLWQEASDPADLVLKGGVYFRAEGLAIRGRKIVAIREVERYIGPATRIVDLTGKFVCPGFNDAHLHFGSGGRNLLGLSVAGLSLKKTQEEVAESCRRAGPGEWVYGRGWDHTRWPGETYPSRGDLDPWTREVPVVLTRVDGHVVWVNSKALELSGITKDTPDPPDGEIVRQSGEPTGILKEGAIGLLRRGKAAKLGKGGPPLEAALEEARRLGLTSIQTGGDAVEPYLRLYAEGALSVRVSAWGVLGGELSRFADLKTQQAGHPQVRQGCLKGFADGTLGSGTALLFEPYADDPSHQGIAQWTPEELDRAVLAADKAGFQIAVHAIGDRGISMTLDAFERARKANGVRDSRHRIEHIQVIRRSDVARFKDLGVIASVEPCHLTNDQRWAEKRVGARRCQEGGYLWKSFLDAGVRLALGTDWPVEALDPMANLYAAVTRQTLEGTPEGGWFPGERLRMDQAIEAYTLGSAYAEFAEKEKGSLEPGKWADLVILDTDLLRASPREILKATVVATLLDGKVVYGELGR